VSIATCGIRTIPDIRQIGNWQLAIGNSQSGIANRQLGALYSVTRSLSYFEPIAAIHRTYMGAGI